MNYLKILICARKIPYPIVAGDTLRIFNLSSILKKEHELYLLYSDADEKSKLEDLKKLNIFEDFIHFNVPNINLAQKMLLFFIPSIALTRFFKVNGESLVKRLEKVIEDYSIDVIHSQDLFLSLILSSINKNNKLFDLVDSISLNVYRDLITSNIRFNLIYKLILLISYIRLERYLLSKFAITTVVSSIDKAFLQRFSKKANIEIISNGVDSAYFSPIPKQDTGNNGLLFFGSMDYSPNIESATYVHKKILPKVVLKIPDVTFYIVGNNPPEEILKLADSNTVVTGYVEDIRPYISRTCVVIVIMQKGSGMKNKILEAMAMGKPIVANRMACEGLTIDSTKSLFIANNEDEISNYIIDLLQNEKLRRKSGEINREIVLRHYSWDKAVGMYLKLYNNLINRPT